MSIHKPNLQWWKVTLSILGARILTRIITKRGMNHKKAQENSFLCFLGLPLCLLCTFPDLFRPLYQSSDGAAALRKAPVGTVGMDLIAFVFSFFQGRGEDNAAAGGVGFHGVGERGGVGQTEDGLEHLDHIFER